MYSVYSVMYLGMQLENSTFKRQIIGACYYSLTPLPCALTCHLNPINFESHSTCNCLPLRFMRREGGRIASYPIVAYTTPRYMHAASPSSSTCRQLGES